MYSQAINSKPPKSLLRSVGRAIANYEMIQAGDRILVGVSGGKDSLSLLNILLHLRRYAPVKFDLAAITVNPQIKGFDPSPLKHYMAAKGVNFFYQSQAIEQRAVNHMGKQSFCSFCSRMKRGIMYATAKKENYNVLALAQHLDDLAESFLMSAFHGGQLRTMKACYTNDTGELRVIRPLIYTRERQTAAYSQAANLPVIPDNCPACFDMPTQRQHMKELLAQEERHNPNLFKNLLSTLHPLLDQAYYVRNTNAGAKD